MRILLPALLLAALPLLSQVLPEGWQALDNLNTPYQEFSPTISPDGSFMIFSSDRPGGLGDQDLWISHSSNGVWGAPENLTILNSDSHDQEPFLTYDGRALLFSSDREGGYGVGDLYLSYKLTNGWSRPFNFGPDINTSDSEKMPSLSMDGSELYFSRIPVDRTARKLKKDQIQIYRSKNILGKWRTPEKLPPPVNTGSRDCGARIMPDNRTLLFASAREGGRGSFDIWKASRNNPEAAWSSVTNFSIVNTAGSESHFTFSIDGRYMVLSAWTPDEKYNLYGMTWEQPVLAATITLQGRITNLKNGSPASASLVVESFSNRNPSFKVSNDPVTGRYSVTLPAEDSWSLTVEAKSFMFFTRALDLRMLSASSVTNVSFGLAPLEAGRTIVVDTIYFSPDSANLREESRIALDRLTDLLHANPSLRLLVKGHVAAAGGLDGDPQGLSEQRAEAVRGYLVNKGISPERLESKGFGESQPVADNATEEGRRQNRRTEFEILQVR